MVILIKQLLGLMRLLHSTSGHIQLAISLTLGMFLGFSPFFSLQTLLILLVILIFNVNQASAFIAAFFFKFLAFMIDPLANVLGKWALENESLRPLWTQLYNVPLVPYTRFNNSIAMGSFIVALIFAPIMFFVFKGMIQQYRVHIVSRIEKTNMWKAVKASKYYDYYAKYDSLYGGN